MGRIDPESRNKANRHFFFAFLWGVCGLLVFGVAGLIASGDLGFISVKLAATIGVLAFCIFGAAIQQINAALYYRSGFGRRHDR
jgi:hypothetical protein